MVSQLQTVDALNTISVITCVNKWFCFVLVLVFVFRMHCGSVKQYELVILSMILGVVRERALRSYRNAGGHLCSANKRNTAGCSSVLRTHEHLMPLAHVHEPYSDKDLNELRQPAIHMYLGSVIYILYMFWEE